MLLSVIPSAEELARQAGRPARQPMLDRKAAEELLLGAAVSVAAAVSAGVMASEAVSVAMVSAGATALSVASSSDRDSTRASTIRSGGPTARMAITATAIIRRRAWS